MANPKIKVKRSSVEGKVPAVSQLERGELAVNSYDGKVYILKDQFSVGIATTTHTINPWNEPGGVGAGISYSGDVRFVGSSADILFDKSDNALEFDDDVELKMGDSGDLLIFHKSSNGNSIIREQGGGVLSLQTNGAYMNIYDSTNQQTMAQFTTGGAVQFRYAGTIRLQTTSSGADVTGTLVTDGLTVGNYNMPTTLGAQDTVLKSDGTNVVFGSAASATFTEKAFTATQGQTVFTDTTALPTYVQVFVNGIKIRPSSDFSKSGASITLSSGATAGDEIDIVRFD